MILILISIAHILLVTLMIGKKNEAWSKLDYLQAAPFIFISIYIC